VQAREEELTREDERALEEEQTTWQIWHPILFVQRTSHPEGAVGIPGQEELLFEEELREEERRLELCGTDEGCAEEETGELEESPKMGTHSQKLLHSSPSYGHGLPGYSKSHSSPSSACR
jgi:hypothetical protein